MKFLDLLLGASTVATVLAAPTLEPTPTVRKRKSKFQFTGVNESGAEFGNTALPGQLGKDFTWPAHSAIDTMVGQGMNTFRVATMMERIIPTQLTGTFNETYVAGLDDIVSYITGKGAYAIIDPHNFGRYYSNIITDTAGFKAWWTTVAKRYATNERVIFDINNEFHDEDNAVVAQLNQAGIDGIRAAGATSQYIFVEGNSWTGAWHWVSSGTATDMAKLTDPSDKIVYEMHQYLDSDGSGTSTTCVSGTIGRERITEATAWLKANGKKGIIGETAGGANTQCISAIQGMLSYMQDNSDVWTGWLWWGGGPWWGDYIYSIEPPSGIAYTGVLPSITQFI
ncbi:glycoside hydrolase family 5 protein [Pseudomassariella vexata]|uniref:cellulase n=1 Tax=Pseudomassariella vexata TaxID=1141098 RepID=A0A1Y2DXV7_9PEZI|nr:glycoside hydrolase family 5 protein [Pseudomassariella vexata]ORY64140.1 glycoside hydrolase family 5 protein [Pseudomassariella vexata]